TALVRSVLVRDPAKLRLRGRDHDLATIVMRALAKEPGRRFPTARDMADDLGRYLNGEPVRSRRVSWIERGWRQVRRYPRVSASLAAALLVVAVSLSFYFVQQRSSASDRERRLTAARADLGGHRYAAARDELERLAQRFPGDAEIGAVFAEAEAQLAVDRLLVLAADHADNIELADVRSLVDAGASAHGERSALLQLGAVVALGHRGDRALARERLAALVGREDLAREFAAIDAWLEQRPLPWQLPDAREDRSPDLAMLTAMVRRLAGDQPRQLLAELLRCAPAEARTPRHVFMEAVVLTDLGRFDVAAGLLRGLASEHAWPAMWRWLAHAQIELGRLERASFSLRMAAADRSRALEYLVLRHRLTAAGVYDYLEVARRFASELEAEQDRSPAEEQFLAEVSAMVDPGAVPAAVARLAALERGATNRLERDRLVALQVQLSGWHLPGGFGDEPAREQHAQFVDRWLAPAARLGNPVSRAIAGLWIARSLVRTGRDGDLARGLERFHEVAKARPDDARAAMEFAIAVIGLPAAGGDEVQRDAVMRGHM
ncbi:MAG: hypothetical protein KAI24_23675, partial [Planctomycetes bacterium]|nr:hypothetical protein [Planctomycetota bacterium]